MTRLFLIALSLLATILPAMSQTQSDEKFKLAQSYEQSGDFRNAARLYQELYAVSKSERNFDGVTRTLTALGQFSSLAPLVEERLSATPSVKLYALYGAVLWRAGKTEEAEQHWTKGLQAAGDREQQISVIAAAQAGLRLYDKAISTYMLARKSADNTMLYAEELAGLYAAVGDFERGADEILALFSTQKNAAVTQGQLSAMMAKQEAVRFIGKKLKDRANSTGDYNDLKLYLWFLRETKEYISALDIAEQIDKTTNMRGRELYEFAEGTKRDGDYEIALKAYSRLIGLGKKSAYYTQGLYGYARVLEYNLSRKQALATDATDDILDRYNEIITNFPNTPIAAECQLRRGIIYWEFRYDAKSAQDELNATISKFGLFPAAAAASVSIGKIALTVGDTARAAGYFRLTTTRYATISPDDADKARFMLGEMLYFTGQFDSAKSMYASLTATPGKDIANDALERGIFLELNQDNPERLTEFARAELLEFQRNPAAIQKFRALCNGNDDIAERSHIKVCDLALTANDLSTALSVTEQYLVAFPEALYGDKAMLRIAQIFDVQGGKQQAIDILTELLARYPRSIYLQEAREKIRKLRGDA